MCAELGVRLLGRVPLEPSVARCCDQGTNLFEEFPKCATVVAMQQIITSKWKKKRDEFLVLIFFLGLKSIVDEQSAMSVDS